MADLHLALTKVIDLLWGTHTFVVLLGLGVALTVWTRFVQVRSLTHGITILRGKYDDPGAPGAITHFQALSAALSGTVGLGNIGGVALATGTGGPGALFWMWVAGVLVSPAPGSDPMQHRFPREVRLEFLPASA